MASDKKHSLTYTRDAARGAVILGLTENLPGNQRVWHLPTAREPLTGQEWADTVAGALGVESRPVQVLQPWMLRVVGLFNRQIAEFGEMLYQYDRDYLFSSEAFEQAFGFAATPVAKWVQEMVDAEQSFFLKRKP